MVDTTPQEALERVAGWLDAESGMSIDDTGVVTVAGASSLEVALTTDEARLVLTHIAHEAGAGASRADAVIGSLPERGTTLNATATVDRSGVTITVTNHVYLEGFNRQSFMTALHDLVAAIDGIVGNSAAETRIHDIPVAADTAEPAAIPAEPKETAAADAAAPNAAGRVAWKPSHRVPSSGMQAWAEPDPAREPITRLAGGVELAISEQRGDWAHVIGSNEWTGWVDARRLVGLAGGSAAVPASMVNVGGMALRPLPLVGALALLISAFVPWVNSGFSSANSLDISLAFLWDLGASGQPYLGWLIIALAVLALGLAVSKQPMAPLVMLIGVLAVAVTGGFLVQMYRGITDSGGTLGDIFDWIGFAPWVALGGGIVLIAGANK